MTDGGHFLDPLKNQPQLLFTSSLFPLSQPQLLPFFQLPQETQGYVQSSSKQIAVAVVVSQTFRRRQRFLAVVHRSLPSFH